MTDASPVGPSLGTRRLRLVPLGRHDLAALHAHWSGPEVGRWLFDDETPPLSKVREELEMSLELFGARGLGIWGVYGEKPGLIGACGFLPVADLGEIEILFSIEPHCWRRGYPLEASQAVLDHAFGSDRLERVIGRCDVPNVASARLLERLGMTFEKREPIRGIDCFHYSVTRDAYLSG